MKKIPTEMDKELLEKLIKFQMTCPTLRSLYEFRLNKRIKSVYSEITGQYKVEKLPKDYKEQTFENTIKDLMKVLIKSKNLSKDNIDFINKLLKSSNDEDVYMAVSILEGSAKNSEFIIMQKFWSNHF